MALNHNLDIAPDAVERVRLDAVRSRRGWSEGWHGSRR
jgi:hypothetical protein